MNDLLKTGTFSILLGKNHYEEFFSGGDTGCLMKISRIVKKHNELLYLDKVRSISNYKNYFSIPQEKGLIIKPGEDFYNYLKKLVVKERMTIFDNNPLFCFFIPYDGEEDLQENLFNMQLSENIGIWKNYKSILKFAKHILAGLYFLHDKKIAHLDIKPENIVINKAKGKFKIIDFGFASEYPFTDFLQEIRGTPGYFPKQFSFDKKLPYLPVIEANDFNFVDGKSLVSQYPDLVYKIDSYCFGRTLLFLRSVFEEYFEQFCFCFSRDQNAAEDLNEIILSLLDNDCRMRSLPQDLLSI